MEKECYEFMKILSIDDAKKFAQDKVVVIITGVTGQDGSFMADFLLHGDRKLTYPIGDDNFVIFGGARRLSVANHENIAHLEKESRFHLINFDLTDAHSIAQVISQLQPDYFINFAAQSFVKSSWDFPAQTWETNTTSMIHILESIRLHCPDCRFYNAGSSEEFGNVQYSPQDEKHPMRPRSPYGASKSAARQLVKVYRESYGLYAVQGWLFNHEGTRRGEEFVTRKVTKGVARVVKEMNSGVMTAIVPIELGNLDAKRDWTDAEDCVQAVWRMLNQDTWNVMWLPTNPSTIKWTSDRKTLSQYVEEYVVGSGESHTIREFVDLAFQAVGVQYKGEWVGKGVDECYVIVCNHGPVTVVRINPSHYRPAEVENLCSNPALIKRNLGWSPTTSFKELIWKMVHKDLHP